MDKSLKPLLRTIVDGTDADYLDIRVEESESSRVIYRGKELDDISRTFELGGCLRAFSRGNWLVATFNRVDDSLRELVRDLCREVRALPARTTELPKLEPLDETVRLDPKNDPRTVPLAAKHDLIRHYNEIVLKTPGIVTTLSAYADLHKRVSFLSSDNRFVEQEFSYTGFACSATARDGTNIQSYSDSFGKSQGFESVQNREPLVERIAKIALDLLRAEPVQAGKYTVIIDPLLGGVFCHEAFGHLSEADHIYSNERLRELMKIGTQYGTEELTIADDATLPGERGSYRYDDEGVPARRTDLIRQGRIAGHLHNRETAQQMQEPLSGNARAVSYQFAPIVRMANTFVEPRQHNIEEMFDATEHGLYVVGSRGGMTELEAFTFSSQYAYLIEAGRKTKMVRDVTLAGNIFETLRNIDMIGDDLVMFGGLGGCGKNGQAPLPVGMGAPHIRIKNVVIGGR